MDCPVCGEPDMIFYAGQWYEDDNYREPDMYECTECGHAELED
ncbi:hypothetical protein SEA_DEJAVU_15 [Microbacterium Phage DejaVu]|nr:hypothetical protein SEA_PAVLO_13 [Microbacterium phage Pavlo]WNM66147.1 hypothetical protein SEA_DEJAVU_15 [Microbacterium Phage DejaVu]